MISYAQNFEDVLLHRVFGGQATGFYVDVGAFHPVQGSVTKTFYDRGWSGINVEPGSVFEELAAARPRDVNLRMVVLDRAGEVGFLEDLADPGMSRVVDGETPALVRCETLEAIVRRHGGQRPIDFLKLDTEGSEAAIIGSTDWRVVRPTVLLVEATAPWSNHLVNQDWEATLLAHGYLRAYFDGINCFYVVEDRADLLRCFAAPVNALDRFDRFDPMAAGRQEALRVALARIEEGVADAAGLRAEVVRLTASLAAGEQEIAVQRAGIVASGAEHERVIAAAAAYAVDLKEWRQRVDEVTAERDRVMAACDRVVVERDRAATERDRLAGLAARMDRLVWELRWPEGPGAVRAVLPLARLLRCLRWLRWLRWLRGTPAARPAATAIDVVSVVPGSVVARPAWGPAAVVDLSQIEGEMREFRRMLESTLLTLALDVEAARSDFCAAELPNG